MKKKKYDESGAYYRVYRYTQMGFWSHIQSYEVSEAAGDFFVSVRPMNEICLYKPPIHGDNLISSVRINHPIPIADVRPCGRELRVERYYASEMARVDHIPEGVFDREYGQDLDLLARDIARHFDLTCRRIDGAVFYPHASDGGPREEVRADKLFRRLRTGEDVEDLIPNRKYVPKGYASLLKWYS